MKMQIPFSARSMNASRNAKPFRISEIGNTRACPVRRACKNV